MPYSQLHQRPKERLESTQMKMTSCLDDLASVPDNEFVELVWENGQVLMQGQSNKTRKTSPAFTSHVYKTQGRDDEDAVTPKLERFGTRDSAWNDLSSSGPSGHMGMSQDDELARWLNYPLDDYSEFFSDLSGVNQNTHSVQNNAGLVDKNNSYVQVVRDSRRASIYGGVNSDEGNASKITGEGPDLTKTRVSKLYLPPSQQCQTSFPSHRSRVSDFTGRSALRANCDDSNQKFASTSGVPDTKVQKQGSEPTRMHQQPSNSTGFMNFSHFLRPAALIKSNQKSIGATASPDVSSTNMLRSSNKVSVVSSSNPIESTVIDSTSVSRSIMGSHSRPISLPGKVDVKSSMNKPPKEPGVISQEGASRKSRSPDQVPGQASSFAASAAIGRPDNEKGVELVVTSSSVCSGNSTGGTSNDPNNVLKRKSRDAEESEYPSEDVEEESVGARKPATARGGTGTKRSRAAEVHNLSERRRRDRINEKMRALQELIPNCNKVDKASMLDEAIEYLKTLQLQLQIMSMGTGMYMSPMMLPPGMQHMHASNIAHFSPMSVGMGMGMGMGMGFGMGMLNVSGGSPGCPLIQVPPMHGAHFPCPPVSGSSSLPPMTGSNHPMFGLPGQGLPMPVPPAPFGPLSAGPAANSALLPVVSGVTTSVDVPNSIAPSCTKDPMENINSQMLKTDAEYSRNQMPIQGQTTKEGLEQPAALQRNDQNPRSSGNGAINPNL